MKNKFTIPEPITGNLAKYQVILELLKNIKKKNGLKILDVGCVGLRPLDIWRTVFEQVTNFELFGIDIAGVDYARKLVARKKWKNIKLLQINAYKLSQEFENNYFDIVVSTQVLEHIRFPGKFLGEIKKMIKPNGLIYLTCDSAYYPPRDTNLKQRILDCTINYVRPLRDVQLERLFKQFNFLILEKKFYNINRLKEIHNHLISCERKDDLLDRWYKYESFLNDDKDFIGQNKQYFMGIYYKLKQQ